MKVVFRKKTPEPWPKLLKIKTNVGFEFRCSLIAFNFQLPWIKCHPYNWKDEVQNEHYIRDLGNIDCSTFGDCGFPGFDLDEMDLSTL